MKKKQIALLLIFTMMISLITSISPQAKAKIRLSKTKLSLVVGQRKTIKVKGTKKAVKWSTSKKRVATVKKGKITAKKKGIAIIKAKVARKTLKCKVTVKAKTKTTSKRTTSPKDTKTSQLANAPSFLGFKTYSGEKIEDVKLSKKSAIFEDTGSLTTVNSDDQLFIKLTYKNPQRDSIVEIVLNDSQYGKKQIYSSSASINRILSVDTYYEEAENVYITDVLLCLPANKADSDMRDIDIEETCFLRETVGLQGYADMSKARSTCVSFRVSRTPVPNTDGIFKFQKNSTGYTVKGLNTDYAISKTLYFPRTYKGLPVNELAWNVLGDTNIENVIIPETIELMRTQITSDPAHSLLKKVYFLGDKMPKLTSYSGIYYVAFEYAKPKVIVNENALSELTTTTTKDVSWYWTYYDKPSNLYYFTESGTIYQYKTGHVLETSEDLY